MSSKKQNKSSGRKSGGRSSKAPPKAKGGRPQEKKQPTQYAGAVLSSVNQMSSLNTLPVSGVYSTSAIAQSPHGSGIRVRGMNITGTVTKYANYGVYNQWGCLDHRPTGGGAVPSIRLQPFETKNTTSGRLEQLAQNYTMFRFTRVVLHYVPDVGTGEDNQFCIVYLEDPTNLPGNYSLVDQGSFPMWTDQDGIVMMTQPWLGAKVDFTRKLSKDWFYIDSDLDTDAGFRQSFQGGFTGAWLNPHTATISKSTGSVWMEYECELVQPYVYVNLALLSKERSPAIPRSRRGESKHSPDAEQSTSAHSTRFTQSRDSAAPRAAALPPEDTASSEQVEGQDIGVAASAAPPTTPTSTFLAITACGKCACSCAATK